MENTLRKIDDDLWMDDEGNHYYEETILRYRVYTKSKTRDGAKWRLYTSHNKEKNAKMRAKFYDNYEGEYCYYKVVDAGEETTIKRLVY